MTTSEPEVTPTLYPYQVQTIRPDGTPVTNTTGQVYAITDVNETNPLPLWDWSGTPIPEVVVGDSPVARWMLATSGSVRLITGGLPTIVTSFDAIEQRASEALSLGQANVSKMATLEQTFNSAGSILPAGGEPGQVLYRASAERAGVWGPPPSGGGTGVSSWTQLTDKPTEFPAAAHQHSSGQIQDSTTLGRSLLTASSAEQVRLAIGAGTGSGTSNLRLGSTADTAAAGNHAHSAAAVQVQPVGSVTATNAQDAIAQLAASQGAGTGSSAVLVWRYVNGAYPALPATRPAGVQKVEALGPDPRTIATVPGWIGKADNLVPLYWMAPAA